MRKFLIRFLVYLIPLPLYMGFIYIVDPYNFADKSHLISYDIKLQIAEKMDPFLWKMLQYKHDTSHCIILGDSRANKIQSAHVTEITGNRYYNFSYPGGTLSDMIETFWIADKIVDLKEVYIGVSFNLYNGFETNNHVKQASAIMKNFFTYSFSKITFISTIKCIGKQFFSKKMTVGLPDMNKDEFWNYELEEVATRYYQKYKYPDNYHEQLIQIADYCHKKDIRLVFFMPPNHIDWQKRVADFGLLKEQQHFITDIGKLGPLYNMDTTNEFTKNKVNYLDPVHPVNDSILLKVLWHVK
ncbi:MAG TPA: hypothetical protein VK179_01730 [Bacteroidales bacterium]|nr:hypothetical protein [Bacteroidales bacterium]